MEMTERDKDRRAEDKGHESRPFPLRGGDLIVNSALYKLKHSIKCCQIASKSSTKPQDVGLP